AASPLFPFELGECCRRVPSVVVLEQLPAALFGLGGIGCRVDRRAPGYQTANIRRQPLKILALFGNSEMPIRGDGPMPGYDLRRRDLLDCIECCEPAPDAAVEHGNVPDEQEVTGEQSPG